MPGDLKGVVVPGYGIDLGWLESTDNLKVLGYEIYRDDMRVGKVRRATHFMHLGSAVKGRYTVRAFDYNGNLSESSRPLLVP